MTSDIGILQELLALARSELPAGRDMGYTLPDGKHHIYIYPDQGVSLEGKSAETFYVIEPNRVIDGAHKPMGDTYLTGARDLSEVVIGCQWCLEVFKADREMEMAMTPSEVLPDELIVRMAHEAGWMEAEGKIEVHSWDDLCLAIRDAISEYYNDPGERNPFSVEETLNKIMLERFPSEPDRTDYKEIHLLICTEETTHGINVDVSLHPSSEAALAQAEKIREEEDLDETRWNFDLASQIVDISRFKEVSPQTLAQHLCNSEHTPSSLDAIVQAASAKAAAQQAPTTLRKDTPERL